MGKLRQANHQTVLDPLWYKDAIIYEVHVRAFQDSNSDGIGDLLGLTQRLDYLQELGVTAIWLLPFYPSPLKDDGYDIADYYSINPIYGTLKDFKVFLNEAHRRKLRVITELVVNHTSDRHPWFERSRRAKPGSAWRDFYVWSESPDKYKQARIIFRDFETSNWTWDPVAQAYFWHRFYSHQPDLNYDNPLVRKEIERVLDFWLDLGVDGLRLDAVPYLHEREGTSCENLPETHEYLKTLREHVDANYGDRMLLAEANQWPEDAVSYFGKGKGDECHMAFHFPLMPRIFMAVRMEDRVPIVDILEQTPAIPETSQWALFLRNHDELTLEMVTDEERDYMYRVYANEAKARINLGIRRRLAPLLGNDRKRIELLHLLLLSYPGTPVLYYGDEIAMGDNIFLGDRNGVRTPMQWSSDKNAGFSRASPHALYLPIILDPEYHYEAVNVEAQQSNLNSLWWWLKRVLALRKRYRAFGRGSIKFLQPENRKILAFIRSYESETILVVANLSRFPQPAQLDLSDFKQMVPVELFGRAEFPPITDKPYALTLNPHAAFWFALESAGGGDHSVLSHRERPALMGGQHWEEILSDQSKPALESTLGSWLSGQGWFGGRHRRVKSVQIRDQIDMSANHERMFLLVLLVEYLEGDPEEYLLPLGFATASRKEELEENSPHLIIARLQLAGEAAEGVVYDAVGDKGWCRSLLDTIVRRRSFDGLEGELKGLPAGPVRIIGADRAKEDVHPSVAKSERSNTAIVFGDKYFLKLFRRVETGTNPDVEVRLFLSERKFDNIPALAGLLECQRHNGERFTVAMLTQCFAQAKSAWNLAMEALGRYFERISALSHEAQNSMLAHAAPGMLTEQAPHEDATTLIGTFLEAARLLGLRTAQMHIALSSDPDTSAFAPEAFTPFYQRSLYQSMRNLAVQTINALRRSTALLPESDRALAEQVIMQESQILQCLRSIHETPLATKRIRCHGDLHLGEVLQTGKDFVFVDFEGDSSRPVGERRIKRSPLRDVAGMIRSFDYATYAALLEQLELGRVEQDQLSQLEPWTGFWHGWVSSAYLGAYLEAIGGHELLPGSRTELAVLLKAHLLEKAIYQAGSELKNRPLWAKLPLRAILQLVAGWNSP
jgi:maltose alpha-D-glucosyltransferase/alpha-amylase